MSEAIKINKLEIENVKRVKAVKVEPSQNGLTVIGGRNKQGKTSVLDAIAWTLGGDRYKPSKAQRDGSVVPPHLKVVLSNGLVVERTGKNSSLKVLDPEGNKGGQQLLKEFVEELALNIPKFMQQNGKEKANTLLQIIGVGDQLHALELKETEIYNERHAVGREADRKKKFAEEQPYYPDAPKDVISVSELIQQQQEILAKNGENARKRQKADEIQRQANWLDSEIKRMEKELEAKRSQYAVVMNDLMIANKDSMDLHDESTEELEQSIANVEAINIKVRANLDKDKAEEDANILRDNYDQLTAKLNDVRKQKTDLLHNANLPLPELSVEDGELIYEGQKWDNMSGSDQLKVATAIVRKLNPKCGFVLLDKLEQMDIDTMNEFGHWLEEQGLQAIATRVSTGDECSIIIEDGYVEDNLKITLQKTTDIPTEPLPQPVTPGQTKSWKEGWK